MELPSDAKATLENIYYIIGFMVVTGFSAFVSGIIFIVKKAIWLGKLEGRVDKNKEDLDAAFQKIRQCEALSRRRNERECSDESNN